VQPAHRRITRWHDAGACAMACPCPPGSGKPHGSKHCHAVSGTSRGEGLGDILWGPTRRYLGQQPGPAASPPWINCLQLAPAKHHRGQPEAPASPQHGHSPLPWHPPSRCPTRVAVMPGGGGGVRREEVGCHPSLGKINLPVTLPSSSSPLPRLMREE